MDLTIDGVKLYGEVTGPEHAPPVLAIHGFPVSGAMWEAVRVLLDDRVRFINPDLRGMGRSQASDETSMATYVDDCLAWLDEIGERRRVTVMGLSMGGYIVFEFFRRARERVKALILSDTRCTPDTEEAKRGRLTTAEKVLAESSELLADAMIDKIFAPGVRPDLKSKWRGEMARTDPRGAAAALRAMAERPDSTPTCSQIDVPTLIIVGDEDAVTPPQDSQKMHELIADSQLETIPGAGHMPPIERPRLYAEAVGAFVRRVSGD